MAYVFDASFGHAQITTAAVKAAGAAGVILYAGCNDNTKNVTKAELQALIAGGTPVGLVIENYATDAIGGGRVGTAQGKAILADATAKGYDVDHCVLFAGYDTDSHASDWPTLLAFMEAFAAEVPVPGYYGDSDSIDYLAARHPDWVYWQSDSRSYSPKNPTLNDELLQLFNDPRAHGLPVDVDVVEKPLPLMGAPLMALDPKDPVVLALEAKLDAVYARIWECVALAVHGDATHPNGEDSLAAQIAKLPTVSQVAQAVIAALPPAATGGVTAADIEAAVSSVLGKATFVPKLA